MVAGGGGRRGGARAGAGRSGVILVVACLMALATMMVGVGGEMMEAHTFIAPFNDVQVDGKRLVSKYVIGLGRGKRDEGVGGEA